MVAVLVAAGLLLGPVVASAGEQAAQQAANARKESPYTRYAREHAKTVQAKPARVKPTSSVARAPRAAAPRGARH